MTVPGEEAAANYVPAAAVIRRQQALFGITGRQRKLECSRVGEESGIPGVAVKCVDIGRNTCGVDSFLDHF